MKNLPYHAKVIAIARLPAKLIMALTKLTAWEDVRHLQSPNPHKTMIGQRKYPIRVGYWNVGTVLKAGKLENVKREMK